MNNYTHEEMDKRIKKALDIAIDGGVDGAHHKMWVIDQMVRALTDCPIETLVVTSTDGVPFSYQGMGESDEYLKWVAAFNDGEDGPDTYEWDTGIAP